MHLLKIPGALAALALLFLPAVAWPAEDVVASAKKLADAAIFLPAVQREEVRRKATAIILLAEYGRLLPSGLSPGQCEVLENIFLDGRFDDSVRRQQAAGMVPADTVSFDGGRLDGGGFARIDSIIGTNGCPIALDRRLPTRLVPLNQGEADRLHQAASVFFATPADGSIRERTDALYRARLDRSMVGDGIFYRPYAGRTDDLYYRLVQENPSTTSEMNFYAIAESLPGRHYHPLTGIGSPALVPSPWFSVSEILSGGGLLAVEDFKSRSRRADVRNPFFGFAARVLPFLSPDLESSRPGGELNVSKAAIRSAIENPRRLTPRPVEPIFNDPSRFFGCLVPQFIRVARRMSRAEMAEEFRKIDFGTPLPDVPDEPVGNEVLVNPSKWTKVEFFQELPALLALDSSAGYNPDADPLAGPPQMAGQQPPTPASQDRTGTTPIVLVQALPSRAEPLAAPAPTPAFPPPPDKPLVASIPLPSPPAVEAEPAATPAPEQTIPEQAVASTSPPQVAEPGPTPPALAAATSTPPAPIVALAETEFPASDLTMPKIPLPPLLSAAILSLELPLSAGKPALPAGAEPASLFGPLLADRSTPAPPPSPAPGPKQAVASAVMASPTPRAFAAVTPVPPAPIVALAETEFPGSDLAMLKVPLPPLLSADILSLELPLPAGKPAFPAAVEPSPLSGPLLADRSTPAPRPSPAPEKSIPAQAVASAAPPMAQEPAAPPAAQPPPASDAHFLAVVTPEIAASEKYLSDIASSDSALSKNAATLHRVNCYLQWLNAALEPVEAYLGSAPALARAQKTELQAAAAAVEDELSSLLEKRQSLGKERDQLLAERGRLRSFIEGEPIRLTTAKLDALLGRPIEASKRVAQETSGPYPKLLRNFQALYPKLLKFSAELPKSNIRGCFASNN